MLTAEIHATVSTMKLRMDQMGLSSSKLAEKLGVTRQRIYQILTGEYPIRPDMANEICEILNCRYGEIFELQDNPKKIIAPIMVDTTTVTKIRFEKSKNARRKPKPEEA